MIGHEHGGEYTSQPVHDVPPIAEDFLLHQVVAELSVSTWLKGCGIPRPSPTTAAVNIKTWA